MGDQESEEETRQISWNQLFQNFVSSIFVIPEDENHGSSHINSLQIEGSLISSILPILRQHINFVRSKYAHNISPYAVHTHTHPLLKKKKNLLYNQPNTFLPLHRFSSKLPETYHLSVLSQGLATYSRSALSIPQSEALSSQISDTVCHWLKELLHLQNSAHGTFTYSAEAPRELGESILG